jgi:hypothetical protein
MNEEPGIIYLLNHGPDVRGAVWAYRDHVQGMKPGTRVEHYERGELVLVFELLHVARAGDEIHFEGRKLAA